MGFYKKNPSIRVRTLEIGFDRWRQENCLGCGRCESTCPNEAISIEISDINRVDELIKRLEAHVEVS